MLGRDLVLNVAAGIGLHGLSAVPTWSRLASSVEPACRSSDPEDILTFFEPS